MKWIPLFWIMLAASVIAAPDSLSALRRQVEEQERQIRQLEVENSRLRYMLTEAEHHVGDPLTGTKVSGSSDMIPPDPLDLKGVHVVMVGDTLSEIAAERGVHLNSLLAMNELSARSTIRPGQRLRLPDKAPVDEKPATTPTPPRQNRSNQWHQIRPGENLYRISLRYRIDLDQLLAANPTVNPTQLRVGQQIRIPQTEPMLALRN